MRFTILTSAFEASNYFFASLVEEKAQKQDIQRVHLFKLAPLSLIVTLQYCLRCLVNA